MLEPQSADVFRAVADPTRRAILDALRRGEQPVNGIASAFPVSRPAISKHLRLLREAKLVVERRRGRQRVYALDPRPLDEVNAWLNDYRVMWRQALARLKTHVESQHRRTQR
ncbi:MAG: winged helix-turn-helix transcriptional regulator [Acidobacteria bacterium]|nr:winged helix-turn-helix transcriptional regulator [Acidobacteriota bacterium]